RTTRWIGVSSATWPSQLSDDSHYLVHARLLVHLSKANNQWALHTKRTVGYSTIAVRPLSRGLLGLFQSPNYSSLWPVSRPCQLPSTRDGSRGRETGDSIVYENGKALRGLRSCFLF